MELLTKLYDNPFRWLMLRKYILTVAVCLIPALSHASTWQATVNGTVYDFSTISGTYDGLSSTLNAQAWWGNGDLANQFRDASVGAVGYSGAAFYAYNLTNNWQGQGFDVVYVVNQVNSYEPTDPTGSPWTQSSFTHDYVVATAAGAPEIDGGLMPQALLLLGGLGLVYGRRRVLASNNFIMESGI